MENLLDALQNADRICKQANVHLEKSAQIEQEIAALPAVLKRAKTKGIVIGVACWFVFSLVGAILNCVPAIGGFLKSVCSFAGIGIGVYLGMNIYKKAKAEADEKLNQITKQMESEQAKAQQIFDANYDAPSFLHDDYWYPMATSYLIKAIASKRVATLGDALDRFDAQLHRWKVEEANAQLLAQQQAQAAYLKSIDKTSKVNAAANVANAFVNIANKL